jgi:outer membrane protein insertion porin family
MILLLILLSLAFSNTLDLSALDSSISKNLVENHKSLLEPPLNKEKVDDILRIVYSTKKFRTVKAIEETNDGRTTYRIITETIPQISKVEFVGKLEFNQTTLSGIVQIQSGENYDAYKIKSAIDRLKEHYRKNAYLSVKIEPQLDFTGEDRIVRFIIEPNQQSKISTIYFNTTNKKLKDKLISEAKSYRKDPFTEQNILELQNEIREYLIENKYYAARVSDPNFEYSDQSKEVNVSYKITEDYQFNLLFSGNSKLSSNKLIEALNFKEGDYLGVNPASDIRERLREFYKKNAYANIQIETTQTYDKPTSTYKISLRINEGKAIKIKAYNFDGAVSRSSEYYTNFIKKNSGDLLSDNLFSAEELEIGLSNLITHLQNQGFLMAQILTSRINYSEDKSEVEIYIRLDEGPLSVLQQVNFNGAKVFPKEMLLQALDLKEGQALQLEKVEQSLSKLSSFYKENGYLEVGLETENQDFITYSDNNTKATLNFNIKEGDQIIVQQIVLSGNSMTKDYVILKSLDFKENDVLTLERVRESEAQLKRLGLFSSINIAILPSNNARRIVTIDVAERYPGTLTFGAGVSNELELTFRGYTGLAYRNLFGTARAIQGRFQLKSNIKITEFLDYSANASYLEPFLFGSKTKGKINVTQSQELTSSSTTNLEALKSSALVLSLERDLSRFLKFTWKAWGLEINSKFEIDDDGRTFNEEKRRIAEIGPTVELDYRDNPFVPKNGTYTRWNLDYSAPDLGSSEGDKIQPGAKEIKYVKTSVQFNQYMPFFKNDNITFAYSLRTGYLKNLGNEGFSAVPQEKMFFLGGLTTIRGFESNSIPNPDLLIESGDKFPSLLTESQYYMLKTEVRLPIYNNFGTALFYDAGGVTIKGKDVGDKYREAVGLSLQILTPIGAINLGYGHKLDRKERDNESEGEIFFSIGDF